MYYPGDKRDKPRSSSFTKWSVIVLRKGVSVEKSLRRSLSEGTRESGTPLGRFGGYGKSVMVADLAE